MGVQETSVELVGMGVGGARQGGTQLVLNESMVPVDWVNVNSFLGVIAACSAKKILALLPSLSMVVVAVSAYGSVEREEIAWLEVSVEARGNATEKAVEEAFWHCPIMKFLRDKIRKVEIRVER